MLKEIMLVHHTHTDWGYTTHASQMREMHCGFIEDAIGLCLTDNDSDPREQFRWTCESAFVVDHFLKTRSGRLRDQFLELVNKGFIEITAGPLCPSANNTDKTIRAAMCTIQDIFHHWNLPCNVAMFCDINGLNYPWVDELCNASVKYLSMSMNFYAGSGMDRYKRFHWTSPSGNKLLVWNGHHYNMGYYWGLIDDGEADMEAFVPARLEELKEYPYDKLLVQVTNIPTDNMGPHEPLPARIRQYNELARAKGWPLMRTATLSQWFSYLDSLQDPVDEYKGDWSDWWSSILPNNPRSISIARESERRLSLAEEWIRKLNNDKNISALSGRINELRKDLFIVNEHTFGFSSCSTAPYQHGALACVAYQLNNAYTVLYSATSLLADIMERYGRMTGSRIRLIDNELNGMDPMWATIADNLSANQARIINLRDSTDKDIERSLSPQSDISRTVISQKQKDCEYISNGIIKVGFDRQTEQLFFIHTGLEQNVFERRISGEFGQLVFERPADNNRQSWFHWDSWDIKYQEDPDSWPKNSQWLRDCISPDFSSSRISVSQDKKRGQIEINLKPYDTTVKIGGKVILGIEAGKSQLDMEYQITISETCDPASMFIPFPFALKPHCVRADVGGQWITPFAEQLPGSCRNWLVVHEGVYLEDSSSNISLLWTGWDAPVFMPERICYGPEQREKINSANIFSWALHNYWKTNVNTIISGLYKFRYQIKLWDHPVNHSELNQFLSKRKMPDSMVAIQKNVIAAKTRRL